MKAPLAVIALHIEVIAFVKTIGMALLNTIRLRNFGIAFSQAKCVIVEYICKTFLKSVLSVNSPLIYFDNKKTVI